MTAKCSEENAYKHSALVELVAAENYANFFATEMQTQKSLAATSTSQQYTAAHKVFLFSLSFE